MGAARPMATSAPSPPASSTGSATGWFRSRAPSSTVT
ncbi:hypothetical protein GA0115244_11021, partial [Streptomyces sp. DvalAA-19]